MILTINCYPSKNGFMPAVFFLADITTGTINRNGMPWHGIETEQKRLLVSCETTEQAAALLKPINNHHVNDIIKNIEPSTLKRRK